LRRLSAQAIQVRVKLVNPLVYNVFRLLRVGQPRAQFVAIVFAEPQQRGEFEAEGRHGGNLRITNYELRRTKEEIMTNDRSD
jgi:hypothetical protein